MMTRACLISRGLTLWKVRSEIGLDWNKAATSLQQQAHCGQVRKMEVWHKAGVWVEGTSSVKLGSPSWEASGGK